MNTLRKPRKHISDDNKEVGVLGQLTKLAS